MALSILPDAEKILSAYLRSRVELDPLVGDRIYTELPRLEKDRVFPLVRITRIGGGSVSSPSYLDRALFSFDVWGGTKKQARDIAAIIAAVLEEAANFASDDGYLAGTSPGSLRYIPDESFETRRPRYVLDAIVYLRPS